MSNGAHRRWTLTDWQNVFDEIYGHRNRASGEVYIWFRILEETGELIRETRYKNREGIKYHLPDAIAWLCAFCTIKGFDLNHLVLERYREGCPWCAHRQCVCPPGKVGYANVPPPTRKKKSRSQKREEPDLFQTSDLTLGDWEASFQAIYGERNNSLEWLQVAARLTEQAGLVAKSIRLRQASELLKSGVADVFGWTIAVFNALKATGLSGDIQLADFIFDKYPNWCAKCHNRPCECPAPIVRVFVSSVMDETKDLRLLAKEVLEEERFIPVMFENFKGQFFFDQEAEAIKHLDDADLILMILDQSITPPVYAEFYAAVARSKPVLILLREKPTPVSEELQTFIANVAKSFKYERYRDENDFRYKLITELRRLRQ